MSITSFLRSLMSAIESHFNFLAQLPLNFKNWVYENIRVLRYPWEQCRICAKDRWRRIVAKGVEICEVKFTLFSILSQITHGCIICLSLKHHRHELSSKLFHILQIDMIQPKFVCFEDIHIFWSLNKLCRFF